MKISNKTPGPRGLHTDEGMVWIDGYSTAEVDKISSKLVDAALATGWFVKGSISRPGEEERAEVEDLKAKLAEALSEVEDLKAKLAATAPKK